MARSVAPEQDGFTLVEVLIALVVLAITLTTLLGLHTSVIDRSIQDSNRLRAMLVARQILADIEVSPKDYDVQQKEGTIGDFLSEDELSAEELKDLSGYQVSLTVENWGIPENPAALRKISLIVAWGTAENERFTTNYFIVNDKEDFLE